MRLVVALFVFAVGCDPFVPECDGVALQVSLSPDQGPRGPDVWFRAVEVWSCDPDARLTLWNGATEVSLDVSNEGDDLVARITGPVTTGTHRLVLDYIVDGEPAALEETFSLRSVCDAFLLGNHISFWHSPGAPARDPFYRVSVLWIDSWGAARSPDFDVLVGGEPLTGEVLDGPTGSLYFQSREWRPGLEHIARLAWTCGGARYSAEYPFTPESACDQVGDVLELEHAEGAGEAGTVAFTWDPVALAMCGVMESVTLQTWQGGPECLDATCVSGAGGLTGTVSSTEPSSVPVTTAAGSTGAATTTYVCGGTHYTGPATFWRGDLPPGPVEQPQALVGRVYGSTGRYLHVVEPQGSVRRPLEGALGMAWLPMIEVTSVEADAIGTSMLFAVPTWPEPKKVPCADPIPLPAGGFDGSALAVGPADVPVQTAWGAVDIQGVSIDGEVSADGTALQDLAFEALFDMRAFAVQAGYADARQLCDAAAADGFPCQPCNGDDYCLPVRVEGIDAWAVADAGTDNTCDVGDDDLILWEYGLERVVSAVSGSSTVTARNFDGVVQWTVSLDDVDVAIGALTAVPGGGAVRVINSNASSSSRPGTYAYCDISYFTGARSCTLLTVDIDLGGLSFNIDCATVGDPPSAARLVVAALAAFVGLRRPRRSRSREGVPEFRGALA